MRFPPLTSTFEIEKNGYLSSFPHLAGSVFSFEGNDAQALELEGRAARHEDWSEFQSKTDAVLLPGGLLPGLSADRPPRSAASGRRDRRHRQRLGLPQRAVGRSRADALVPHARVRPDRRSRRCRDLPRRLARADARPLRAARPRRGIRGRLGPVLRARRPDAGREPEGAGAQVRARRDGRRAGADGDRLVQLPPGPFHARSTRSASRAAASPTPAASRSGSSGSRSPCSGPTASTRRRGRPRCARSCGRELARRRRWSACSATIRRRTARTRSTRASGTTSRRTASPTSSASSSTPVVTSPGVLRVVRADGLRERPVDVLQAAAGGHGAPVRPRHPRDPAVPVDPPPGRGAARPRADDDDRARRLVSARTRPRRAIGRGT